MYITKFWFLIRNNHLLHRGTTILLEMNQFIHNNSFPPFGIFNYKTFGNLIGKYSLEFEMNFY